MLALLLAASLVGPPAPQPCPEARTAELFHGFVADSARVGAGLFADLWSTEFALARCPTCREGNWFGFSKAARIYLKGLSAVLVIAACDWLRHHDHAAWATWLGRGALGMQSAAAASNVWRGTHVR